MLIVFCKDLLGRYVDRVPHGGSLMMSVGALLEWTRVTKDMGAQPSHADHTSALEAASRVMYHAQVALVRLTPKWHLFCHLTHRTQPYCVFGDGGVVATSANFQSAQASELFMGPS